MKPDVRDLIMGRADAARSFDRIEIEHAAGGPDWAEIEAEARHARDCLLDTSGPMEYECRRGCAGHRDPADLYRIERERRIFAEFGGECAACGDYRVYGEYYCPADSNREDPR